MRVTKTLTLLPLFATALSAPAWAQRTAENALTSAEDAFGTTVGGETIGLYSATDARGFSPILAGNVRIEGLYFDSRGGGGRQVRLSSRVTGQATVRVGLSAQSYPFPAPTGIADYTLRIPGDDYALSTLVRIGPIGAAGIEVDGQIPITDNISVGIGIGGERNVNDYNSTSYGADGAIIGRWNIGDSVQIIPFWTKSETFKNEWGPFYFAASSDLPPKPNRDYFLSQPWAEYNSSDTNFGAVLKARWNNWQFSMGAFRSVALRKDDSNQVHFKNIQPDGSATLAVVGLGYWDLPHSSKSGEVRLSRFFNEGPRRHTIHINLRGKAAGTGYGGNTTVTLGPITYDEPFSFEQPVIPQATRGREYVRQATGGVSYQVLWRNVGEFSAGLQRTSYERYTVNLAPSRRVTQKWLYNATLAAYLSERFALYGSYTKGLEDSPRASPYAVNGGAGAPASVTEQIDGGLRYTLMPGVRLVAGVFQVKKPFYELDENAFFGQLGNVRHRGIEISLSGSPLPGLTVVAGLVGLQARLSGPLVDNGTLGAIPPDTIPLNGILNLQYGPESWNGFSLDARMSYNDSYMADIKNTFKSGAVTLVDLGARYRFRLADQPALLRFQVKNVFDVYEWKVTGTQRQLQLTSPRIFNLQLTVDF